MHSQKISGRSERVNGVLNANGAVVRKLACVHGSTQHRRSTHIEGLKILRKFLLIFLSGGGM